MEQTYWFKQSGKPLFPELEWSQPETRAQAGKLLVIGGTGYEFAAPANAYGDALDAGVGTAKVLLPSSMQKVVSDIFPEAEFTPSTPSGSFAREALASMLDLASWADGVLLPGDLGRNSETTVVVESFLEKYSGQVTFTKDAADALLQQPVDLLARTETLLVLSMGQLRRLGSEAHFPRAFTSEMDMVPLMESLHEFSKRYAPALITRHRGQFIVAINGQVSTTPDTTGQPVWRLTTAAHASVWWLQNPTKPFEALTTAVYQSVAPI